MEKRPYDSRDDSYSSKEKYPRTDSYSSRSDGYSSGYSKSDTSGGYSKSDSYGGYSSKSDGYSNSYSKGDSSGYSRGSGGYSSGGRGGYQSRGGGYGSQNNADNWSCSSCKFSNFANRSSCYKCRNPKEGGGGGGGGYRNGGGGDWKKSSSWGNSNGRDKSYSNNSWNKKDSYGSKNGKDDLIDWDDLNKNGSKYAAERFAHLPSIIKDLYVEDPAIASMDAEQVKQYRYEHSQLSVTSPDKGMAVPNPVHTFHQAFAAHPGILSEIKRQGFTTPSPIQSQAWPILMKGYDMIGTSQTGSGKTLAFLLPGLLHIVSQPTPRWERVGPTCLVLAPTRELAQQIEREVSKFHYDNIR